jgi:AraC-like DNA-binding protein
MLDIRGEVVLTKCISIACGGSMPLSFTDYERITAENNPENIMAICYIQRGSGEVCHQDRAHSVCMGNILILGNNRGYTFTASESLTVNLIAFDRRLFSNSYACSLGHEALSPLRAMARGCEVLSSKDICYSEILRIVSDIWKEAETKDSGSPLMAVALLWQLAALLKREMERRGDLSCTLREARNRERLAPVIDYIFKHYDNKIALADLANLINMSVPNFSSVFRETMGVPPMEYLTRIRLQNAADLLQNTDKKIIDVAEECGFFSISNFIKAFHNGMNMSPSQYRKERGVVIQPSRT